MSSTITGLRLAVSIIEFAGSLLSFIGASFILVCYMLLPMKRHFRHTLILSLAVADAVNALCDGLSGLQILIHRQDLHAGIGCTINGFIGQMTVQATDTSIFAIACITVYTITRRRPVSGTWSWNSIILTWAAIWALPLTTSFTALGMGWYGPVSGNWCWLVAKPAYMRYVLTHGWRFLFIFLEVGLYIFLNFYLRRHFRNLSASLADTEAQSSQIATSQSHVIAINPAQGQGTDLSLKRIDTDEEPYTPYSTGKAAEIGSVPEFKLTQPPAGNIHIMAHRREKISRPRNPRLAQIERVLLLNAYPLLYIILWVPGLVNRLVEASGHTSNVTQVLQSSTQFVGLANALTFGWNEEVARQLKQRFGKK